MAPVKETVLKITSMRYRAKDVSEEEFHEYSSKDHAPKAAIVQARHKAVKVAQYHTPSASRQIISEKLPWAVRPGWTVDDHDIQVSVWIRNTEDMVAIVMDPDFQALVADEDKMVDRERATLVAGWEEVYVEDGKIVNVEDGKISYAESFAERSAVGTGTEVFEAPKVIQF